MLTCTCDLRSGIGQFPRASAKVAPGSACGGVVSALDIAPTVLDLAGVRAPDTFQGKSLTRMLSDPAARVRQYAFAEHNWHDYRAYERAVRSERFTYVRNWVPELTQSPPADAVDSPTFRAMRELHAAGKLTDAQRWCFVAPRPEEELYDLASDPHSLHNLAASPRHADTLAEMRHALDRWRAETADTFDPAGLTPDRFDRNMGQRLDPKP